VGSEVTSLSRRDAPMRSNGMLAALAGTLVLVSACSDDGGISPPENAAPVANFAVPACTIHASCEFASTSTDDAEVTAWRWDFDGDGSADASTANASFTYTAAGSFDVSLTVQDAQGLSHTKTSPITIAPAAPANTPPTAGFTYACSAADCSFTSTSTDVAPGTIVTHAWDFGDEASADGSNPSHTYNVTVATDFTVTLTVTDDEGATDVETQTISVAPAPLPNTPPTAGFTHSCDGATCSFTSTSTDVAPGTIVTYAWEFGDGGTAAVSDPSHDYVIVNPTDFTVTLTVTDDEGASDVETQTISVSPPPPGAEGCITSGTRVDCLLSIAERSTIKLKLTGISCDLPQQRVVIPPPSGDQVFLSVCSRAVGDSTRIFGGPEDTPFVFEAGSQVTIRFVQGTVDDGEPTPSAPAGQVTGSFPSWVINFEDGDNPGGPGEPDFADVVLQVEAVPSP
jgi:PKD repeat protein